MGRRRVVIACGGTGGHLFPGIAVAQVLQARGHEVLLLISEKEIDAVASKDHPELRFEKVPAIAMPSPLSPKIIPFVFKFWKTLSQTKKIVKDFQADAVLGMGGFTSLPPALAGRKLGAKTFIHESNAVPGKANKLTARFCSTVLLGLSECAKHFPGKNCQVVGTPLRASMRVEPSQDEAWAHFGLEPDRSVIMVMGGSQGAQGLNQAVLEALPEFEAENSQFIWLTGKGADEPIREELKRRGIRAYVAPFSARLDLAYSISDLAVARSGASSLAELSYFGIPALLIPYPFAADDHQTRNAEIFSQAGAAELMPEPQARGGGLGKRLHALIDAPNDELPAMAARMKGLGISDAAERIADLLEN